MQRFVIDSKARWFEGEVTGYNKDLGLYEVVYEDGDSEDCALEELRTILVACSTSKNKSKREEPKKIIPASRSMYTGPKKRTWEECFEVLRKYKEVHGDCLVPSNYADSALYWWVCAQRTSKDLSHEKKAKLKRLGIFDGYMTKRQQEEALWIAKWKRLKVFKQKFGHCRVPRDTTVAELKPWAKELGFWVKKQRRDYRERKLLATRKKKLESLGFEWVIVSKNGQLEVSNAIKNKQKQAKIADSQEHQSWRTQYEALKTYKEANGHCMVPCNSETRKLGLWVAVQRRHKQQNLISKEREKLLEKVGFVWDIDDVVSEQSPNQSTASVKTEKDATSRTSSDDEQHEFDPPSILQAPIDLYFPSEAKEDGKQHTRYSASCEGRPGVSVRFRRQFPGQDMTSDTNLRLCKWDPFWTIKNLSSVGVTSPIDNIAVVEPIEVYNIELQTAGYTKIKRFRRDLVQSWGQELASPKHGDRRLLLRMLPMKRDAKTKQKRADCHQWPKGSYLMVNGVAVDIRQRKQQRHDRREWKMQSYLLDVTPHIKNPANACDIAIACHDSQQFIFCVALCEYTSPDSLIQNILEPRSLVLDRPSVKQMKQKAIRTAKQSVATIIDDSDSEDGKDSLEEKGKFVFSAYCPISKTVLKNPVRGKHCKHFQVGLPIAYLVMIGSSA